MKKNGKKISYQQKVIKKQKAEWENSLNYILEKSRIVIVFLSIYSTFWCLTSGMPLPIYMNLWMITIIGTVTAVYLLYLLQKRIKRSIWITLPFFSLLYAFVLYRNWSSILYGVYLTAKRFVELAGNYYKITLREPDPMIGDWELLHSETYYQTFFITMVSILVAVIISVVYYNKESIFFYLLYTTPFVILPLALGCVPDTEAFILYVSVSILIMGSTKKQKRVKNVFLQGKVILVLGIFLLFIIGSVHIVFSESTYTQTFNMKQIKNDFNKKANELSDIKIFSGQSFQQWFQYNYSKGIDFGKLGKKDEIHYNNTTVLKVKLFGTENSSLYLKGYVGDIYQGDHWESFNQQNNPNYISELRKAKENAVSQEDTHNYLMRIWNTEMNSSRWENYNVYDYLLNEKAISKKPIKIYNVAAGKGRKFVPYYMDGSYQIGEDGTVIIEGKENDYSLDYYPELKEALQTLIQQNQFTLVQNHYDNLREESIEKLKELTAFEDINSLVRKYYLEIPETIKALQDQEVMKILTNYSSIAKDWFLFEGSETEEPLEEEWSSETKINLEFFKRDYLSEVISAIQSFLRDRVEYTLAPGRTPNGKDYIDYFIYESKKGYCVHYATAATLLFRAVGIPARLVEGYVVDHKDIIESYDKSDVQDPSQGFLVDVKDSNGHAWVEIYIDDIGWVPIEVTSGSGIDGEEQPNVTPLVPSVKPTQRLAPSPGDRSKKPPDTPKPVSKSLKGKNLLFNLGTAVIMGFFVLLYLIIVLFSLRRKCYHIYRKQMLPQRDTKLRVTFLYHRLEKVFRLYGVDYSNQCVDEYADQLKKAFPWLEPEDIKNNFLKGIFQNMFASNPLTEEEYQVIETFYTDFCTGLLSSERRLRKWYLENILCIN